MAVPCDPERRPGPGPGPPSPAPGPAQPEADLHTRPSRAPWPDREAERDELHGLLRVFLRTLPHRQREAVELVELQGLDSAEAAERMEIAPVSVRAHLHKARRALRTHILQHHPHLAEDRP